MSARVPRSQRNRRMRRHPMLAYEAMADTYTEMQRAYQKYFDKLAKRVAHVARTINP